MGRAGEAEAGVEVRGAHDLGMPFSGSPHPGANSEALPSPQSLKWQGLLGSKEKTGTEHFL